MGLLPGVYQAVKKDGTPYFRSSITFHNKHISLGSFKTEALAHNAYLEANKILSNSSYTLEKILSAEVRYMTGHVLSFDKWVILINFRDNKIYFKTPIYIKHNYFLYYLSKEIVLKFAVDDLFYYANHKIMKRGGHLFVSDFGMQVNILSRYGIKNFAVPGRDYIFVNGDITDYRYENIKIINKYNGVCKTFVKGLPLYEVKIHINGDFIVGRYEEETIAAIAYNKAVDILEQKGITKNFTKNFIIELTKDQYYEFYEKISISKKIIQY